MYFYWVGVCLGDIIFKDVNGDNVIDGNDCVCNDKSCILWFIGGLNVDLGYKDFDFLFLL